MMTGRGWWSIAGMLLAGCAGSTSGDWLDQGLARDGQAALPQALGLEGNPLLVTTPSTVRVTGAVPGERVFFVASVATGTTPFCPAVLSGGCLDVPSPARLLGSSVATAAGTAVFSLTAPASLADREVRLQGVQLVASGAVVSNPWDTSFLSLLGDADGDGLDNTTEVVTLQTDPFSTDTDGDGIDDRSESLTGSDPVDGDDPGAEWSLVWFDAFEGTDIDQSKWTFEVNGWGGGNNELQYYTDRADNARIEDGVLVIEARQETYTGADGTRSYTSARLKSANKGDWTYGRFEARIQTPTGQGMWPAFWMLPTDFVYGGWAASGEIDIMELVGHEPDTVHGTLHYGGPYPTNTYSGQGVTRPYSFADDFHDFAVEWDPGQIRWYLDGQLVQTQTQWYSTAGAYPAPFNQRFHFLLNVAVGGNWPGSPDSTTQFPQQMRVDWVKVYQREGESSSDINGGFEDTVAGGAALAPDGWQTYPSTLTNFAVETSGTPIFGSAQPLQVYEGSRALKVWGQFTGAENRTPVYYETAAMAGQTFSVTGVAMTHPDDPIGARNSASLRLLFLDSAYNILGTGESERVDASSARGTWLGLDAVATAPPGTSWVQVSAEYLQCQGVGSGCYDAGSVYFDDVQLEQL